jgi:hypothetical protein
VYLGDSTGAFVPGPESPFFIRHGFGPTSVRFGRYDGDSHLDFAVACSDSRNLTVFYGDGTGVFAQAERPPIVIGKHPKYVVKSHLNIEDSWLDLAIVCQEGQSVSVLLGDGEGWFTYAPGSPHSVGFLPRGLEVGDLNRDGRQDLVAANSAGVTLTHLQGDGHGDFKFMEDLFVDNEPIQPGLADFDGNGLLDIASANRIFGTMGALVNTSAFTLEDVGLDETELGTRLAFEDVQGAQTYDVIRGDLAAVIQTIPRVELGEVLCLENDSPDSSTCGDEDPDRPAPGEAFFYLVRYFDGRTGSYGPSSRGFERIPLQGDCPD